MHGDVIYNIGMAVMVPLKIYFARLSYTTITSNLLTVDTGNDICICTIIIPQYVAIICMYLPCIYNHDCIYNDI